MKSVDAILKSFTGTINALRKREAFELRESNQHNVYAERYKAYAAASTKEAKRAAKAAQRLESLFANLDDEETN
jgi:predicted negative regulator of RcsB-dependent stress response